MVKVIMGLKGSGKTKQMIEMVNSAIETEKGQVVCIERGPSLTFNIDYRVRLVEASHYDMSSSEFLKGFISGLYSGNFDITHIFFDSLSKICTFKNNEEIEDFLAWAENFSNENAVKFTIMITDDKDSASEKIKKYF